MATRYTPGWAADLEYRLRSAFPHDLAGQAIYIVTRHEVGPAWDAHPDYMAFYSHMFDFQMAPALKARGLWQGPGFATLINNTLGFDSLGDDGQWGIVLHEFCHWLDWRGAEPVAEALRPENAQFVAKMLAPRVRKGEFVAPVQSTGQPWGLHELRFHRAALHVANRAGLTDLTAMRVFEQYGLSSPAEYQAAFASEFGATLRVQDALDLPIPRAAADLFAADQAQWKPNTQPKAAAV